MFNFDEIGVRSTCEIVKGGPCGYVIFGASGDLTARKLLPSIFSLYVSRRIPEEFFLVGFGRSGHDHEKFRSYAEAAVLSAYPEAKPEKVKDFIRRLYYIHGNYNEPASYIKLKDCFDAASVTFNTSGNGIFHLAVPPAAYADICQQLGKSGLVSKKDSVPYRRIIIEKPFGSDMKSAEELNARISGYFDEEVIYRIDHYMGKEALQNILVFRFGNSIFGPVWNNKMIDSVQVTVYESDTIGYRAPYFDKTGLLRDMLQSHMLLLSALIGMQAPKDGVSDLRAAVYEFIKSLGKLSADEGIVRAQYEGYAAEQGVQNDSCTETFFALKLVPKSGPLEGVPFYLRSGKAMANKKTGISVIFRENESCVMCGSELSRQPNILTFGIHPKQAISLVFMAKSPGSRMCTTPMNMHFSYADYFGAEPLDDYANLILSCMQGDMSFFWRFDSVKAAWQAIDEIVKKWESCPLDKKKKDLLHYKRGSHGPQEADELINKDKRQWIE